MSIPFWGLKVVVAFPSMEGQKAFRFHKIFICVLKMNESLLGLEQHEGE